MQVIKSLMRVINLFINDYLLLDITGWDLSKHLLIAEEWRVCTKKIVTESIPMESKVMGSIMDIAKIVPFGDVMSNLNVSEKYEQDVFTIEPEESETKPPEGMSKLETTQSTESNKTTSNVSDKSASNTSDKSTSNVSDKSTSIVPDKAGSSKSNKTVSIDSNKTAHDKKD